MEWKPIRSEKPSKYREVVLVVDVTGYYGIHLACFLHGSGCVDMHTRKPIVCTHWCSIPELPTNINHGITNSGPGVDITCGLCGETIPGIETPIGMFNDEVCHTSCINSTSKLAEYGEQHG